MPITLPNVQLQPGATGDPVKQLQDFLVSKGYLSQAQVSTGYGTYGPQTTNAVLALQKDLGIDYSSGPGYYGPKTMTAASQKFSSLPPVPAAGSNSNSNAAVIPVITPPAQVIPTTSQQVSTYSKAAGYTGPSIVDFLSQAGQPTDHNSLATLATQYGIVGNPAQYTGAAGQNTQLLSILKGMASGKVSDTGVPTTLSNNGGTPTPNTPIDVNNLGGGMDLSKILGASVGDNSTGSDIAGLLSLYGASTDAQKKYDELGGKLTDLMGSLGNEGADLKTAMDAQGVGAAYTQAKELNLKAAQLNGELGQFDAETQQGKSTIENQSIPTGLITGQQAQYQKQRDLTRLSKAAELSATIALSQAYQGNATLGMDLATKAVDLKYKPVQAQIDTLKTQLSLAKDSLNNADTARSKVIDALIKLKENEITTKKDNEKQIMTLAVQAASNGAPLAVVTAIRNSPDPSSAAIAGNKFLKGTNEKVGNANDANTTTAPKVFSQTQINKGASSAGLTADDFGKLDNDVKNFFVNNTKVVTQFNKDLADVKSGAKDAQEVIDLQNSSNLSQPVKDYLNQRITASTPSQKSGGKVWWNPLTWFNK